MALIECRECGKQVSDRAEGCPHCGAKLAQRQSPAARRSGGSSLLRTGASILRVTIGVMIVGVVLSLLAATVSFYKKKHAPKDPTVELVSKQPAPTPIPAGTCSISPSEGLPGGKLMTRPEMLAQIERLCPGAAVGDDMMFTVQWQGRAYKIVTTKGAQRAGGIEQFEFTSVSAR